MNEHEATIIRYENQRQLVESLLGDTLQTVARGRVPDEGLMESLCESVEAMRSSNAELELAAMGFDDSAGPGESAFRYIEAIREGVKRELRDRHDRAVATLRSFVGIRSSDAAYDLAIDPYREEARGLLDKLDASDVSVPAEEDEHEIERKMLVLRVISSASFETEEMADLLYEISHAYPRKVYQGIMVRRYSLMDAADMPTKPTKGTHDGSASLDSHTSPGQGPETRVDGRMGEHASVGTGAAHTQGSQADTIRRGDMVDSEDALNVGAAEEENSTENLSAQRSDHTAEGDVKTVEDHVEASESVDESAIDETGIQTEHIPSDEMPAPSRDEDVCLRAEDTGNGDGGVSEIETGTDTDTDEGNVALLPVRIVPSPNINAVSKWKNSFLNTAPKGIRITMPLLDSVRCATSSQLSTISSSFTENDLGVAQVAAAVDYMLRNGFAAQYELPSKESFLCVTEAACSLLSCKSIRSLKKDRESFWLVNSTAKQYAHSDELTLGYVQRRLALVTSFMRLTEAVRRGNGRKRRENKRLKNDYSWDMGEELSVTLNWQGTSYDCLVPLPQDAIGASVESIVCVMDGVDAIPEAWESFRGNVFEVRNGTIELVRSGEPVTAGEADVPAHAAGDPTHVVAVTGHNHTGDDLEEDEDMVPQSKHEAMADRAGRGNASPEPDQPVVEQSEDGEGGEPHLTVSPTESADTKVTFPPGDSVSGAEEGVSIATVDTTADHDDRASMPATHTGSIVGIEALLDTGSVETASRPDDDGFVRLACHMLDNPEDGEAQRGNFGSIAAALTLLEAASGIEGNAKSANMLAKLRLATGVRQKGTDYTGVTLSRAFGDFDPADEAIILTSYCRALFDPRLPYDYELWNTCGPLLGQYDELFPSYPELRSLFGKLLEIHDVSPSGGFSARVLDTLVDHASRSRMLDAMRSSARTLEEKPTIKAMINGVPEFLNACFGRDSDMWFCMNAIAEDRRGDAELVRECLLEYCSGPAHAGSIDDARIDDAIDTAWRNAVQKKRTKGIRKLEVVARKDSVEAFHSRLSLMEEWLAYVQDSTDDGSVARLGELRKQLITLIDATSDEFDDTGTQHGSTLVRLLLSSLRARLTGGNDPLSFVDFLRTGFLSLRDDGMPMVEASQNKIMYFEPWRRVLRHWISEKPSFEEAAAATLSFDHRTFDNLRQRRLIASLVGVGIEREPDPDAAAIAEETAESDCTSFNEQLEIAYAYGRINEAQREELQAVLERNRSNLYEAEDYGIWRDLIRALSRQVDDLSKCQEARLEARIRQCKESFPDASECELLSQARAQLLNEQNFDLVEEYLNRFSDGKRTLPEGYVERDSFGEFISDEVYSPLFDACTRGRGKMFSRFASDYLRGHYPEDWSTRHKTSADLLVTNWPSSNPRKHPEPSTLERLFMRIGMRVKEVRAKSIATEHYLLELRPEKKDQADYQHPISMFGTKPQNPLDVIVLHGTHSPQEIVSQVSAAGVSGMSIVLLDSCLSLQSRRTLAEVFHTSKSKLSPFLVIDQVLALHLALHQETERLQILLKCTLPFTYYQPFVRDGGATADEMFFGREAELRTIVDPQGATIVYGGRQLGKTALLERAESLRHSPDEGRVAVYVSVQECASEGAFVSKVIGAINRKAELGLDACDDIGQLADQVRDVMKREGMNAFLLLIDEADRFLESIGGVSYEPLTPLVVLKRETGNAFKFVLAGLHNVVRYKNAISDNGVFGQLGTAVCVNPLKPADALRLMSRPLTYLGFKVDRYPHIETILTNTNYYPGIIQFFGYELVDSMTRQYGTYYQAARGNPPYELSKEQLGTIMNSTNLNRSIKEKYMMSLALDPRYLALARCIALLTYESEESDDAEAGGFGVRDILDYARGMSASALEGETTTTTSLLLDEMVDMGILAKTGGDEDLYRLRMHRFLSIVGTEESILASFAEELEDDRP